MFGRHSHLILPMHGHPPRIDRIVEGSSLRLVFSGSWTIREAASIEEHLAKIVRLPARGMDAVIDLARLDDLDTAGAWMVLGAADGLRGQGSHVSYRGLAEAHATLLDEIRDHRAKLAAPGPVRTRPLLRLAQDCGNGLRQIGEDLVAITGFLGLVVAAAVRLALTPWRFRWTSLVHQIEHTGLRAVPIIALICLLIGAVVLQQGAEQLKPFGAEPYAVQMLAILALREIGVLLTAVMIAGRSGSAFTAEIGAMKMREEIDAMRAIGLNPIETLVLPRLIALLITLPLLTFLGAMMCLVGGGVIAQVQLGLEPAAYIERLREIDVLRHLFVGMIKTPFAAVVIGLIGCVEGLRVRGNAESLGQHVTRAVVKAIFIVIIIDGLFAIFMSGIGY